MSKSISHNDQKYYENHFGFNPEEDKIPIQNGYKYEEWFPLENDPALHKLGVQIAARVNVIETTPYVPKYLLKRGFEQPDQNTKPTVTAHNRIVFKKGDLEAEVTCTHTAINTINRQAVLDFMNENEDRMFELAQTTKTNALVLSPEEHFAALKSYVEGIAEVGICNMMITSYYSEKFSPSSLPFGFNSAMQSQVINCLQRIAADAIKPMVQDVLLELASAGNPTWFISRLDLLNGLYFNRNQMGIYKSLFGNPGTFHKFDKLLKSDKFRILAANSKETDQDLFPFLAEEGDLRTKWAILNSINRITKKKVKQELLDILVKGKNPQIFAHSIAHLANSSEKDKFRAYELSYERFHEDVAKFNDNIPRQIFQILVERGDLWMRKLISLNPGIGYIVKKKLLDDRDFGVRINEKGVAQFREDGESEGIFLFNGVSLRKTDAECLADIESALNVILCSKLQYETNSLLNFVPIDRVAPILKFSKNNDTNKLLEIDLSNFSLPSFTPRIIARLISLKTTGCNVIIPKIKGTIQKKDVYGFSVHTKRSSSKLYSKMKNNGIEVFFKLDSNSKSNLNFTRLIEGFELYPYSKFLNLSESELKGRRNRLNRMGYLIDSKKTTSLISSPKNKLYQNLHNALLKREKSLIKCKFEDLLELCSSHSNIKIGGSWYNSKMIFKVCNAIQSANKGSGDSELIFLTSETPFPLLIRNLSIPIIGTIAPLTKKPNKE